jgi:hypothetical protein
MTRSKTMTEQRRERATRALADLGAHRSDHQEVGVQCRRAHHLAAIYSTEVGLVYESRTGPHSHGSKDFIDTGRSGSRGGEEYVDLLADDQADDALPAWCDCGPRTLSRSELRGVVRAGVRSVRVE